MPRRAMLAVGAAAAVAMIAAAALGTWYVRQGRLRAMAASDDPGRRIGAIDVLTGRRDREARRLLATLARDASPTVASHATRALGAVSDEAFRAELESLMAQSPCGRVRGEAAAALAAAPSVPVETLAGVARRDDDELARAGALRALGLRNDRAALPTLLEAMASDPSPAAANAASTALNAMLRVRFQFESSAPPATRAAQVAAIAAMLRHYGVLAELSTVGGAP